LHPRGAGAVSPRRASVPPAPLSSSRRAPAPPTASSCAAAFHRIRPRRRLLSALAVDTAAASHRICRSSHL
ncbi:hypothetical protein EE612_046087, partial [Oryza sativa]